MLFIVLPMAMLLTMTPFMLINDDLIAQRQRQAGADWAQRLLILHNAALAACTPDPSGCTDNKIKAQLPTGLTDAGFMGPNKILYSFVSNGKVVSVLDEKALADHKGHVIAGTVNAAWVKLVPGRDGAGTWQFSSNGIRLYKDQTDVSVSPPGGLRFVDGCPAIIG